MPWLVRPANVSDCTVSVCDSHVKRVLTRSDGSALELSALKKFWSGLPVTWTAQ